MRQRIKEFLMDGPSRISRIATALDTSNQAVRYHLKSNPHVFEIARKVPPPPGQKGKWVTVWKLRHVAG